MLSNGDAAALRKELLATCNLHTILDCPAKTFQGAGVKTVVLFFEKGAKTRDIWFYQLDPGRSLGKTTALTDSDFAEFISMQVERPTTPKSWSITVSQLDQDTLDMAIRNPSREGEVPERSAIEILDEIEALERESVEILADLRRMA